MFRLQFTFCIFCSSKFAARYNIEQKKIVTRQIISHVLVKTRFNLHPVSRGLDIKNVCLLITPERLIKNSRNSERKLLYTHSPIWD